MFIGPSYLGRRSKGDIVTWKFTLTVSDVPTTLGSTPAVKCYQDGSNVEFTGGITLTPDYDGKTGLCELIVDTSNASYSAGHFYDFIITAGAIGIVSPIGYVVGHFELIPEPADLRAVNGGSTGATAGKLELVGVKVTATGSNKAVDISSQDAIAVDINSVSDSFSHQALHIYAHGAGHNEAVMIESDSGNAVEIDAYGPGRPGFYCIGGDASGSTPGGQGAYFQGGRANDDPGATAGVGVYIVGGASNNAGQPDGSGLYITPGGKVSSGTATAPAVYISQLPDPFFFGTEASTGPAIYVKGGPANSDRKGSPALLMEGGAASATFLSGPGVAIYGGAGTSTEAAGVGVIIGPGTAGAMDVHAPAYMVLTDTPSVYGGDAVYDNVGGDIPSLILAPAGTGKAINALGQVYVAPTNTNDAAISLVPNGTGHAIQAALAELPQGVPTATPSIDEALMLLYMAMRNQVKVDSGLALKQVYNSAGTRIAKKAISDDGTIYTEAKMTTGA